MGPSLERQGNSEQERYEQLKHEFISLFSEWQIDKSLVEELFGSIAESYGDENRHYHNLEHIKAMLDFLNEQQQEIKDMQSLQIAAWFHDAIYDTHSQENERQSAEYAKQELERLGIPMQLISRVAELIEATAIHQAVLDDDDRNMFLDADLAILGADDRSYDRYAQEIRQEYSEFSDEQFREGRKRILESFLERPRIYLSESVHDKFESQAIQNIRREIKNLSEEKFQG